MVMPNEFKLINNGFLLVRDAAETTMVMPVDYESKRVVRAEEL